MSCCSPLQEGDEEPSGAEEGAPEVDEEPRRRKTSPGRGKGSQEEEWKCVREEEITRGR
jgi:hypothetical protein